MTAYDTTALAIAIIGDEAVEANRKSATRTLRKFLRADTVAKGGKVGTDTPGKGGRYSIDLNKRDLTAMTKRFIAWQEAEAKAQEARRAALADKAKKAEVKVEEDTTSEVDEATDEEPEIEATDEEEGPADEDIDAMILELEAEASDEDDEN